MRKSRLLLLLGIGMVLGCTQLNTNHALLETADNVIEENPDSALRILDKVSVETLDEGEDRAIYNLLITQARHRLYRPIDSDSLINKSIAYFKKANDKQHLAHSYYYKGAILSVMGKQDSAVHYFKEAEIQAKDLPNVLIANKTYESLCNVNSKSHNYEMALDYAKLFLKTSKILKDSGLVCRAYYDIFINFKRLGIEDSANVYYKVGVQHAKNDSAYTSLYYTQLADDLLEVGDRDSALIWLQKAMAFKPFPHHHILLGRLALSKGDTLEARHQWEKAQTFSNLGVSYNALCLLAELYESRGDYHQAIAMKHKADSALFAYSEQARTVQLSEIQQRYDKSLVEENLSTVRKGKLWGFIVAAVIVLGLLVVIGFYIRRTRNDKGVISQHVEQVRETEQKISLLEADGKKHLREVEELKQQIAAMKQDMRGKLANGKAVYETIANRQRPNDFSKQQEQDFVDYFVFEYPEAYASLCTNYRNLTLRHLTFLIMSRHLNLSDNDIKVILNISGSTIRNYRLRTKR